MICDMWQVRKGGEMWYVICDESDVNDTAKVSDVVNFVCDLWNMWGVVYNLLCWCVWCIDVVVKVDDVNYSKVNECWCDDFDVFVIVDDVIESKVIDNVMIVMLLW